MKEIMFITFGFLLFYNNQQNKKVIVKVEQPRSLATPAKFLMNKKEVGALVKAINHSGKYYICEAVFDSKFELLSNMRFQYNAPVIGDAYITIDTISQVNKRVYNSSDTIIVTSKKEWYQ